MAYWILKVVLSPVFHLLWRVKVEGRENVPTHGPAVLAANHQSFCDSFFLPLALRRRLTYVAKAEYFDNWRTAWFFRASGQIPMQRGGGDASQRALDTATEVLRAGGLLGIYPEGTRAPDVRLHRGHTGVARLALGCDVPIIPVGLVGTRAVQPPGSMVMRPFHSVTIRFGPPMASPCPGETMAVGPSGEAHHGGSAGGSTNGSTDDSTNGSAGGSKGGSTNGSTNGSTDDSTNGSADGSTNDSPDTAQEREQVKLREMTDALMSEIARLSGQEYVDLYATRVKAG